MRLCHRAVSAGRPWLRHDYWRAQGYGPWHVRTCSADLILTPIMAFCMLYAVYLYASLDSHKRPRPMASLRRVAATPDLTEQVHQRLLYATCEGELASL